MFLMNIDPNTDLHKKHKLFITDSFKYESMHNVSRMTMETFGMRSCGQDL